MTDRLVIAGGGEHARVVAEAAAAGGWTVVGWIGPAADGAPGGTGDAGLPWLGTDASFAGSLAADASPDVSPALVLGFGAPPDTRRRVVATFGDRVRWAAIIHPASWVSPSAVVSPGAVVLARAVVNTGAHVGTHAIVNSGAIVEHDVRVGAHAHVGPGAAIGGGARVGDGAAIGLGAAVRDHVTVGAGAVVGMGSVVVRDVPDGAVVLGVPAQPRRSDGADE